jgi:hypothetical protein
VSGWEEITVDQGQYDGDYGWYEGTIDLLVCPDCGSLVLPREKLKHENLHAELARVGAAVRYRRDPRTWT